VAYFPAPFPVFTDHERVVIDGTLKGLEVTAIATAIHRTPSVVLLHLENIGQKFMLAAKVHRATNDPPSDRH
jgi:DNA-binding NarL/FixJ family response regulator